uniref:Uncharacterized protein n=1 Tax=Romanomermis culicivorax TaxID=13658 RepID=A0A915I4F4_ROMCU
EDPRVVSKQLQSLLLALLKSNANHNFICNEADFAKYLGEKVKPVLIENLRANGLQFVTKSRLTILIRLVMDSLHASESPIFTNEELKEIIGVLDPKGI